VTSPALEVSVCTRDRPRLLSDLLGDLARQDAAPADWRLTVVDNGSRPLAPVVLAASRPVPVRVLREERAGISRARNRAAEAAEGEWVAFLDDDVRVGPDFVSTLVRALRAAPEAGWYGGRVLPRWEGRRPPWARRRPQGLEGLVGWFDLGPGTRPLPAATGGPFGANFGLRRRAFRDVGPFDTDLGVGGRVASRGEETDWIRRAVARGLPGLYVGGALARHRVRPARFRWERLVRHGIQSGVSHVLVNDCRGLEPSVWGMVRQLAGVGTQVLRGRGDAARQCLMNVGVHWGALQARARRDARR
jgi:GT2 family glycosyltransferase